MAKAKQTQLPLPHEGESELIPFNGNKVRKVFHEGEWWFSVVDVVAVLTHSARPGKYWSDLKKKLRDEGNDEISDNIGQLKFRAKDGKDYPMDAANTETLFRIVQSVPSRKAEPFKKWLAKVGFERLQEINNPELALKRMKATYRAKGMPEDWIEKRARGMAIRAELEDEWNKRGITEPLDYAKLTSAISVETFGVTPTKHKAIKQLKKHHQLRDHMSDFELIFNMLGESSTTAIARRDDANGYRQNLQAAEKGGRVAGKARRELEEKLGRSVLSQENYLPKKSEAKQVKGL